MYPAIGLIFLKSCGNIFAPVADLVAFRVDFVVNCYACRVFLNFMNFVIQYLVICTIFVNRSRINRAFKYRINYVPRANCGKARREMLNCVEFYARCYCCATRINRR